MIQLSTYRVFFFFNDTATTEIYTLSLHDALPISVIKGVDALVAPNELGELILTDYAHALEDRKSTRLNSSHSQISYAVFCLKKKKKKNTDDAIHKLTPSVCRLTPPAIRSVHTHPS